MSTPSDSPINDSPINNSPIDLSTDEHDQSESKVAPVGGVR
jgi:hypothetical protein